MKIKLNDGKTGDVDYTTAQHMIAAGHATEVKAAKKAEDAGAKPTGTRKS